uniref:arylacetamide deacetylase-like n=1 Tax=Styela clava TaxID=7725 RepID=UPI0019396C56|nr:arylacetamide deacetylase-like [Styela clava]
MNWWASSNGGDPTGRLPACSGGGVSVWLGGRYSTPYKLTDYNLAKSSDVITTIAMFDGVEVAIYHPKEFAKKRPGSAMIYFHGGGFTIGSIASYASLTMKIAEKTGMLVIVPEYRLVPDHPFPAGFDDCLRVTKHFIERAREFDVDPNKIVLSGDSAGGNMAAGISVELAKQLDTNQKHPVCMMNLIYPSLQKANFQLPSFLQNRNPPTLPPELVGRFSLTYLGFENETRFIPLILKNAHMIGFDDKDGILQGMSEKWIPQKYKERTYSKPEIAQLTDEEKKSFSAVSSKLQSVVSDTRMGPLAASDSLLRKLPIANVMTCEYDVLRDDGIIFYERMKALGKRVTHQNWEFGAHGLINMYGIAEYYQLEREMNYMFELISKVVEQC